MLSSALWRKQGLSSKTYRSRRGLEEISSPEACKTPLEMPLVSYSALLFYPDSIIIKRVFYCHEAIIEFLLWQNQISQHSRIKSFDGKTMYAWVIRVSEQDLPVSVRIPFPLHSFKQTLSAITLACNNPRIKFYAVAPTNFSDTP